VHNLLNVLRSVNCGFLEREKDAVKLELKPHLHPLARMRDAILRCLFPVSLKHKRHSIEERLASVDTLTPKDVEHFWDVNYVARNSFVYIGGRIPENLSEIIAEFESLPDRNPAPEKLVWEPDPVLSNRVEIIEKVRDDPMAVVQFDYQAPGFPASCSWRDEKAIAILNGWLGQDYGPLYAHLRDDKRLCYGLKTNYDSTFPAASVFSVSVKTDAGKYSLIENEWLACLRMIADNGMPLETLETIKEKTQIGVMKNKKNPCINRLLNETIYSITTNDILTAIESLTPDDIKNAARLFLEKNYIISISLPRGVQC